MASLLLTGVAGESLEDGEGRKWGIKHVLISMLFVVALVKIKKWLIKACIVWTFGVKAEKFLSQFKSRSYVFCRKVVRAMWEDFTHKLKTPTKGNKQPRGNKTWLKYYEEKFDDYFAKLKMEIDCAAQIKGSEWEWEGVLLLEQICNKDKAMDLEANVSEEDKSDVEELFHVETDSFLARFNFHGKGEAHKIFGDLIILSERQSHYDLSLQGWELSYEEVSMALWKKLGRSMAA